MHTQASEEPPSYLVYERNEFTARCHQASPAVPDRHPRTASCARRSWPTTRGALPRGRSRCSTASAPFRRPAPQQACLPPPPARASPARVHVGEQGPGPRIRSRLRVLALHAQTVVHLAIAHPLPPRTTKLDFAAVPQQECV